MFLEPGLGSLEVLGRRRNRDVLDAPETLDARPQPQAREIEERQKVVVANVEEQVRRALVVPIFHQLDQREAEELLIELDRLLDVAADQRHVVDATRRGPRPLGGWPQIFLVPLLTLCR